MQLSGDYHTHTIFSHGKGTVLENALAAKERGLREIAISDHGFGQMAFGLRHRRMPSLIADCKAAQEQTGVRVLVGIEANFCNENGLTDLRPKDYDKFDVFLAGIHRFVRFRPLLRGSWNMLWLNWINTKRKKCGNERLIRYNTKAYINVIEKNPLDVVTHLHYLCFCDVAEVAKAARDHGTYIEINTKKVHMTDEQWRAVIDTGVRFVIDSDAHSPARVGDTRLADDLLSRVEFPLDRIDNIEGRTPSFRFRAYKERHG